MRIVGALCSADFGRIGMTPQEFEELLRPLGGRVNYTADDGMRLAEALSGLDERERKKLAKTARAYWRELSASWEFPDSRAFAALAVLGVGTLADARKAGVDYLQCHEEAAIKLLVDRRPEWIEDWVRFKLEEDYPRLSWNMMRSLMRAGVCGKPESPGYSQLLSMGMRHGGVSAPHVVERLTEEPDLLQDVWRFFEQDVCPFFEGSQWIPALRELSDKRLIDRQRLLDEALDSLHHDVNDYSRSGYVRFYRGMAPTGEERVARQSVFLELLWHHVSSVVKFALDELAQLDKQSTLDGEVFLASPRSVFLLKPKGHALAALKLARHSADRRSELVPTAIRFVLEGLRHDSPDVQQHVLRLLERWRDQLQPEHLAKVRERMPDMTATARNQAEALLESRSAQTLSPPNAGQPDALDRPAWQDRVAELDAHWKRLAGVDAAIEAIDRREWPPPLDLRLIDVPVLTGTEPIVPIQSVDELLDAMAHAMEIMDSADEMERILDGISRLCDQRPADFELRAGPLIARMERGPTQDALQGLLNPYWVPDGVRQLVFNWLVGRPCKFSFTNMPPHPFEHIDYVHAFLDARAEEIERRVQQRRSAPTLSAPTHRCGWLEPSELVGRLWRFEPYDELPATDLIQALLRLAPDNRNRALAAARELTGDAGRAVRWALGSDDGPLPTNREQFAIWLAAGRARHPLGELDELSPLLLGDNASHAILPVSYDWQPMPQSDAPEVYRPGGAVEMRMQVSSPDIRSSELNSWPTLALCQLLHGPTFGFTVSWAPAWKAQWLTSIWPLHCESRLAMGAAVLCQRVNAPSSSLEPNYVYLAPLLEPDRPWSELAYLACWIALVSNDADSRGIAIDCMVQAIDDGRAAVDLAADVLIRLLPGGWVKLNRAAGSLQEIARVSLLHVWLAAKFVQGVLTRLADFPRDTHHLLTLLVELLSELELPLESQTSEHLASIKTTGKAAKLVAQLLKLPFNGHSVKTDSALQQALNARVARATRWSRSA